MKNFISKIQLEKIYINTKINSLVVTKQEIGIIY